MAGDEKLRERLSLEYDSLGGEEMLRMLGLVDRVSAEKLHFNDKKRIVRALEVYYATGKTISKHNEETKQAAQKYQSIKIALNYTDRNRLYTKINLRVDSMMTAGLVNEVEGLLASGLTREHTAMQAIGYKEIAAALQGECAIEEAVEMVKLQSRRYAKRQLSWLNGKPEVNWIMWDNEPDYYKASLISTKLLVLVGIM
jgi:tRNA dimethylallyltransferase